MGGRLERFFTLIWASHGTAAVRGDQDNHQSAWGGGGAGGLGHLPTPLSRFTAGSQVQLCLVYTPPGVPLLPWFLCLCVCVCVYPCLQGWTQQMDRPTRWCLLVMYLLYYRKACFSTPSSTDPFGLMRFVSDQCSALFVTPVCLASLVCVCVCVCVYWR